MRYCMTKNEAAEPSNEWAPWLDCRKRRNGKGWKRSLRQNGAVIFISRSIARPMILSVSSSLGVRQQINMNLTEDLLDFKPRTEMAAE
jgi:hypothetical protein